MTTNPEPSLSVVHEDHGPDHVVVVKGEIDIYTAPQFEAELSKGYATPRHVIIDLRECRYIDSSAISTLHRANRKCGGRLQIVIDSDCNVKRILDITQIDKVIPTHETVEDARRAP
jgi:anti-sigma B factor antagonist